MNKLERAFLDASISLREQEHLANMIALSNQLAAQSLNNLDRQYDLSLLLSVEANHVAETVETKGSLLSALQSHPHVTIFLKVHSDTVSSFAFSPDGKTLASCSDDNTIILWDINIDSWQSRGRNIANRGFSTSEWQQFLGDYRCKSDCPNYPIPEE